MRKAKKVANKYVIQKKSQIFEELSERKFKSSLKKTGLTLKETKEVQAEIGEIHNYFSTTELHNATYKAILKRSKLHAANYNIKQAIFNLGPTGYPFEILCAEMLKAKGYTTKVSCMVKGKNVKHEVDVVANREDGSIYCECKFHGKKYHKNDIKIPLYVNSRYLDIKTTHPNLNFKYAVLSNTKFSKDAIKYSKGVGLLLFSMNYPKKNTFCDIIKKYKVYPITVLKSLRVRDRKELLEDGIVVIKQLRPLHLKSLGLKENEIIKIMQEIKVLTRPN